MFPHVHMRGILRRCAMRKLICLLLAFCLLIPLTACAEGESAQVREGRKLLKEYLSKRGGDAALTEIHADVQRPDASHLAVSDFVKGTFRAGGETYEITGNVVTGEIYTSERVPEFADSIIRKLEELLGLDPDDCVGNCAVVDLYAPAWQEEKPEWPGESAYLGQVIPADLKDMDAYAAQAFSNGDIRLIIYLACRDTDIGPERWTEADIADWDGTDVTIMELEPGASLPAPEELTVSYRNGFIGDRLTLCDGRIEFRQGKTSGKPQTPAPDVTTETHKTPEEQIELLLEQTDVWYRGGSPAYYPAYLYYAVTDLNQNGRLEVISSEYRYDTNVSINRFFEIDETETRVVGMKYDLADVDETEIAPGLVNAAMPTLCFFRDGEYHYSIPTPGEPNENLEIEFFYMLSMNQQGEVSTELLAEKWVNNMTGTTSYLRGLEKIKQREYDGADLIRYEDCEVCECDWSWVLLLDGWDEQEFRNELTDSWERFVFDTLGTGK